MTDQTETLTAVWIDGDPLMEAIATAVWEHCARDDDDMPQLVCDDPRTIAAFAAAVAREQQPAELARAQAEAYQYRTALQGAARRAAVPAGVSPATDRAALREQIAEAALHAVETAMDDTLLPAAREKALVGIAAVLPAPADRAAECPQCDDTGACNGGPCPLRRMAAEAGPADTVGQDDSEDPARIDRMRPEFTEHASVESIDAQLQRARSQERRWHLRVEWLISLREARVAQKARGEWAAAAQQPKEA